MAMVKYTNRKKNRLKSLLPVVVAIFMIFTLTMVLTPVVASPNDNASDKAKSSAPVTNSENPVYLIKNHNAKVKDQFEVRHNFDVGFTARLNEHQLAGLEKAGIIVEPVPLYQLVAPPEKCSPWPSCKNADDDGDSGATRQYVPSTQMPYGITMVNGGGIVLYIGAVESPFLSLTKIVADAPLVDLYSIVNLVILVSANASGI